MHIVYAQAIMAVSGRDAADPHHVVVQQAVVQKRPTDRCLYRAQTFAPHMISGLILSAVQVRASPSSYSQSSIPLPASTEQGGFDCVEGSIDP